MEKILEQEQKFSDVISPRSIQLSNHVRLLASVLRDRTKESPFAADALILSAGVNSLCDYVKRLHEGAETLFATSSAEGASAAGTPESELTAGEKKAMEIQEEIHEFNPAAIDTIKALFMWRDSPEERLREGK